MTIEKFIESFVNIEEIEPGCFGYYPFNMISIDRMNHMKIHGLVGLNSQQCYNQFKRAYFDHDNVNVILAMDFPKAQDVYNDFVFIIQYSEETLKFQMMQYNQDGEIVENEDRDYLLLCQIIKEFTAFMLAS